MRHFPDGNGLMTIPEIARWTGRSRSGVFRMLMNLASKQRAEGETPDWILNLGGAKNLVSLPRLRRRWPTLFSVAVKDIEDVDARLKDLEDRVSETRIKVRSTRADLRQIAKRIA